MTVYARHGSETIPSLHMRSHAHDSTWNRMGTIVRARMPIIPQTSSERAALRA